MEDSNVCINCRALFEDGFEPVSQISVWFHSDSDEEGEAKEKRQTDIPIIEALSSVFVSAKLVIKKEADEDKCGSLLMCFRCAVALSELYQAYIQLLTFSDPAARICRLIRQIQFWHQKQGLCVPFTSDELEVKEEVEWDVAENEEDESPFDHYADSVEVELGGPEDRTLIQRSYEEDSEDNVSIKEEPVEPGLIPGRRQSSRIAVRQSLRKIVKKLKLGSSVDTDSPASSFLEKIKPEKNTDQGKQEKKGQKLIKVDIIEATDEEEALFSKPKPKRRLERSKPRQLIPCPETGCKRAYFFNWRIRQHILADHQDKKPSKCKFCDFKYFDKETRLSHSCISKAEQKEQNLKFRCGYCGIFSQTLGRSRQHSGTHDHEKIFQCQVVGCRRKFRIQSNFEQHRFKVHELGSEPLKKPPPAQCQLCGKIYSNSATLKNHMNIHSSEKKFLCKECGKRFSQKSALQNHKLIHKNTRDYQCLICNFCFKRSCSLRQHYRSKVHADEPERVTELLKQRMRNPVIGPVIIPPKNKFKNHKSWAGKRKPRGSKSTRKKAPRESADTDDTDSYTSSSGKGQEEAPSQSPLLVPLPVQSHAQQFQSNLNSFFGGFSFHPAPFTDQEQTYGFPGN